MHSADVHAVRSETAAAYAPQTAPAPGDALARLERAGPRALEDHELLALVGVRVDAPTLAATGGLRRLLDDPDAPLRTFLLAREDRARVHALLDLHRRWMEAHLRRDGPLRSPEETRRYLNARLRPHPHEIFACLFLDNRHRVIAFEELFRGTVDGVSVHPREVVRCALRHNAAAVKGVLTAMRTCSESAAACTREKPEASRASMAPRESKVWVGGGLAVSVMAGPGGSSRRR